MGAEDVPHSRAGHAHESHRARGRFLRRAPLPPAVGEVGADDAEVLLRLGGAGTVDSEIPRFDLSPNNDPVLDVALEGEDPHVLARAQALRTPAREQEPVPEPESAVEPEAEGEPVIEDVVEPEPEAASEPETAPDIEVLVTEGLEPDPVVEPESVMEPAPESPESPVVIARPHLELPDLDDLPVFSPLRTSVPVEPAAELAADADDVDDQAVEVEVEPAAEPESIAEPEAGAELAPQAAPEPELIAVPDVAPEPESVEDEPEPVTEPVLDVAPEPEAATDVVAAPEPVVETEPEPEAVVEPRKPNAVEDDFSRLEASIAQSAQAARERNEARIAEMQRKHAEDWKF